MDLTCEDELLGYVYFQAGPTVSEATIDFVAVAVTARRRGIGAQLVAAAVHSAFEWPGIGVVRLSVNAANLPALRLYERLRFTPERRMMGFERNAAANPTNAGP